MITMCNGGGLERLLEGLEAGAGRYAQVVVCSPFIDQGTMARLVRLAIRARQHHCGVRLITTAERRSAAIGWPCKEQVGTRTIIAVPHLHAKVYLAIGRKRRDSWVAVSSANLTQAGLRKNVELGLLVRATSPEGAQIVEQARCFLERLATNN